MTYYVYTYSHPITLLPFYVGKGSKNRATFHLKLISSNLHVNKLFQNTYKKIKHETGIDPIVRLVAIHLLESEAYLLESKLIKMYGRKLFDDNGILCNLTLGGIGPTGYKHSRETRELLRLKKQNISEETRQKLSQARKGKKDTPETKAKRNAACRKPKSSTINMRKPKSVPRSDSHKNKIREARSKTWKLTSPNGEEFIVTNLKYFCNEKNLPQTAFQNSAYSGKVISKGLAKGWQALLVT